MARSARMSFEDAMKRLEAIVEQMEAGEIGLEESITRYEEAMRLAAHCRQVLDDAELRLQQIQADGGGVRTAPFEPPADAARPASP
ncbi:MAG: exodeoxyribonuclease VII small subunit [Planctomycetia bacterium]|nr:MAG: exodeoxyribonuclease VII small subunit [Planctomycetia bacterium]